MNATQSGEGIASKIGAGGKDIMSGSARKTTSGTPASAERIVACHFNVNGTRDVAAPSGKPNSTSSPRSASDLRSTTRFMSWIMRRDFVVPTWRGPMAKRRTVSNFTRSVRDYSMKISGFENNLKHAIARSIGCENRIVSDK